MKLRIIAALAAAVAVSACQTVQHATPSGRPEVTINAPMDDVKATYVGTLTNFGYSMVRDTNYQIVMEKPVDNLMANVLLSSRYDPTVEARITATFLNMGGQTRVTTDMGIVRNGGSAFEAVTPLNGSQDSVGVQSLLNEIKSELEAGKSPGQVVAIASQRDIGVRAGVR